MTAAVAITLVTLAVLDGSFAGFRASVGRTGLVSHRQSDYQAARRGAVLVCALLAPAIAAVCADALSHPADLQDYTRAGTAMLAVYGPFALLVLTALACYAALSWRLKYLASAVILGPCTLLRPVIVLAGGAVGLAHSPSPAVATAVVLSVSAVLAVEPVAGRLWYAGNRPGPACRPS
ncbi:MAG: oxidoreductase [Actinobacteria bacterium]|nr:oxidoreductase [Actinomycetota bacterium]MBO0835621.1 oxidoreductase [Actinomycetota bacterium]